MSACKTFYKCREDYITDGIWVIFRKEALDNQRLIQVIKKVSEESRKTYSSPRITANLKRQGFAISRLRVAKLMRKEGLKSKIKGRFRVTTNSNHGYSISENNLSINFKPKTLNETWVSDITYIKTGQVWLYLTTIIDLFDRQVIGWALSKSLFTNVTIILVWKMALTKRKTDKPLIFHSDRGVRYASKEFRKLLKTNCSIIHSMSIKDNCWDNAVTERFFKTLMSELIYH